MSAILLKAIDHLITRADRREVLRDAAILVRDGMIVQIGDSDALVEQHAGPGIEIVDLSNRIVMPGLVNAHNHTPWSVANLAYSAAATLGEEVPQEVDFIQATEDHVMAPMAWFDDENIYDLALSGLLDQVKHGTTTTADANNCPAGLYRAAVKSGVRYVLQPQMITNIDIDGIDEDGYITQAERCIRDYHIGGSERVTVAVHPSWPWNCTESLLVRGMDLAERYDVQFATHLYELQAEKELANSTWADRGGALGYLDSIGLLKPRSVFFHGIELDRDDMEVIASSGAALVHNPELNAELFHRVADVQGWLEKGITTAIGTDYGQFDMFTAMKLASLLPQMVRGTTPLEPWKLLELATIGGAKAMWLDSKIGTLEVGKRADLIGIDLLQNPGLIPFSEDVEWLGYLLVKQSTRIEVAESMIDGVFLRRDGHFVHLDEREILGRAREWSRKFVTDYRAMAQSGKPWHRKVHPMFQRG